MGRWRWPPGLGCPPWPPGCRVPRPGARAACGARPAGALHNSHRSLRERGSNRCNESVNKACCAAARSPALLGASTGWPRRPPQSGLRGRLAEAPPGTGSRDAGAISGRPAASLSGGTTSAHPASKSAAPSPAWGAPRAGPADAPRSAAAWAAAQHASISDPLHLFEVNERSEWCELCNAPMPRAPQGTPSPWARGAEPGRPWGYPMTGGPAHTPTHTHTPPHPHTPTHTHTPPHTRHKQHSESLGACAAGWTA